MTLARTKAVIFVSQIIVQLSFLKINWLLSATSILSCSHMAYNTTETLDKLTYTDYVDFANVKADLDDFLDPKMTPTIWILN